MGVLRAKVGGSWVDVGPAGGNTPDFGIVNGSYTPTIVGTVGTCPCSYTWMGGSTVGAIGLLFVDGILEITGSLPTGTVTFTLPTGWAFATNFDSTTPVEVGDAQFHSSSQGPANVAGRLWQVDNVRFRPVWLRYTLPPITYGAVDASNPWTWNAGNDIRLAVRCRAQRI